MIPGRIQDALDALEMGLDESLMPQLTEVHAYLLSVDAMLERFLEAAKQAEEVAG